MAADIEDVLLRFNGHVDDGNTLERIAEDLNAAAEASGLKDRTIIDRHKQT